MLYSNIPCTCIYIYDRCLLPRARDHPSRQWLGHVTRAIHCHPPWPIHRLFQGASGRWVSQLRSHLQLCCLHATFGGTSGPEYPFSSARDLQEIWLVGVFKPSTLSVNMSMPCRKSSPRGSSCHIMPNMRFECNLHVSSHHPNLERAMKNKVAGLQNLALKAL